VNDITNQTGEFLLEMARIEHNEDNGVTIEHRDGQWIVAGVVIVDSIDSALELAAA
jgi:hypothetical protein